MYDVWMYDVWMYDVCGKHLALCDPVNDKFDSLYNSLFLYVVVVENHSHIT